MKNKILSYILQLVAAIILVMPAIGKLSGHIMPVELFTELGMEPYGRVIIGILELLAVILLIIPQSGLYGAFLGLGIMAGAIIGHLTAIGLMGIDKALIVFFCCLIVIFLRRQEASIFKNMFNN